ncbi:MAG: cyclase family protein, partial [Polyangia bacterium]|nr:cyclase family protein [Polyangia bacterium]
LLTSLHAGSLLDAPAHLFPGGPGVDLVPLEACLGVALVMDCHEAAVIEAETLEPLVPAGTRRVLFKTRAGARPDDGWLETWPAPTPKAATLLLERGVTLVGLDSPSIDLFESKDLPVHRLLLAAGVVILENLDLGNVEEGTWELIALPLKLEGMDGSPVRAVLRSLEG